MLALQRYTGSHNGPQLGGQTAGSNNTQKECMQLSSMRYVDDDMLK